jgi:hypothetical protein
MKAQKFEEVGQVVAWLGAAQAQDYPGTLWALGLRMHHATEATIEQAIADRRIVRTWPMRGTLHFVAAEDIRWMLALLTPRVVAGSAGRYRQLELDEATFSKSRIVITRALEGGNQLIRAELFQVLEQNNISAAGQRGIHILSRLSQEGLLCFGSHQGKQPTFVLLDEWLPQGKQLAGEEALAELAKRYFTSHGPATLQDLVWWSGLKVSEARAGLEMVKADLREEVVNGQTYWLSTTELPDWESQEDAVYLLPGFDEYLLGYRDRSVVLHPDHAQRIVPGNNGMFMPTIISNGRVVGTWKRTFTKANTVTFTPEFFTPITEAQTQALESAAARYARFVNRTLVYSQVG